MDFMVLLWFIIPSQEYYENETALVVENAELNHVVNIFGCKNVTVQVKGKVNAVSIG